MIKKLSYIVIFVILIEMILGYTSIIEKNYSPKLFKVAKSFFSNFAEHSSNQNQVELDCNLSEKIYGIYNPKSNILGEHLRYEIQTSDIEINELISKARDASTYNILMLGGSELMGYSHPSNKIHSIIQSKLRNYFNSNSINIINAGNAGAFIKDEIYIFYDLKNSLIPDMVIQHTGFNDSAYISELLGNNNQILDYLYNSNLKGFIKNKKGINIGINENGVDLKELGSEETCEMIRDSRDAGEIFYELFGTSLDAFSLDLKRLNIQHVIGIQGYDSVNNDLADENPILKLKKINSKAPGFINFNKYNHKLVWIDSSHTSQESAYLIADIYYSIIIDLFAENIKATINKNE